MKSNTQQHQSIRQYQLGQSAPEDSAHIEERLMTDDEFYQELLIVEDELVDQYLAGQLTASEKESFETHFLATPERREKLRFARNLKKYVSSNHSAQTSSAKNSDFASESTAMGVRDLPRKRFWLWSNPIVSYSLAAAVVLVVSLTTVLIVRDLNSPKGAGKVLIVELAPGLSRGEQQTNQITVPADTSSLQLQLRVANVAAYQTYRAILQTTGGREISSQAGLTRDAASNDRIVYSVPANLLTPTDYSLKLSGINPQGEYEDVARYYFRVTN